MKHIKIQKQRKFREYLYNNEGRYIGYIYMDFEGDYLFRPSLRLGVVISPVLGKGKCLKEIAERLEELNYGKDSNKCKEVKK